MRIRFYKTILLGLLTLVSALGVARAEVPVAEASRSLANKIGVFRAVGSAAPSQRPPNEEQISSVWRKYKSPSGKTYLVEISQTRSPSAAYSLLTLAGRYHDEVKLGVAGTASHAEPGGIYFYKGSNFGSVSSETPNSSDDEMVELAREIAQQLDGENEIPVLVKHLPQWEKVGLGARYAVTNNTLKQLIPNQPILDVVSFEGGVEAVVAQYDAGKLAIVEFNTPQIATTNDHNIAAKLNELRAEIPPSGGTSLPSAYRRVGNYSVFVFDARSPEAANQLIDQVKYQQVVQWLGENPFAYEQATREFTETTLGVFVSVVKASGLALVTCLAVGGLFGTLLFRVRRSQQRAREAYADSDAMLRLNLDELTPESDPARLLGRGN